jgi:cyclophilin family peptidyl-prolyl cis-trans isomerase
MAVSLALIIAFSVPLCAQEEGGATTEAEVKTEVEIKEKEVKNPMVLFGTSLGDIKIELFEKEAPISVANFISYVEDGFYDGTVFHRVIPNFVIQAGGMNEKLQQKEQKAPIKNEATNGLKNLRGTLSMARTSDINSGTSHFFLNLKDNSSLDHKGTAPQHYGYAVFGKVADDASMTVVDKIAAVKTTTKRDAIGRSLNDVPVKAVVIEKATMMGSAKKPQKQPAAETEETAEPKLKKEAKQMKEKED